MADIPSSNLGDQLNATVDGLKSDLLGQLNSKVNSKVSGFASPLPWQSHKDRWFNSIAILTDRWDQLFPYRLIVIDSYHGNRPVNGTAQVKTTITEGDASIKFTPLGHQWIFTLPITPQQLSITDQYAIATTATLRGVLEEHNGVKFKMINVSGTMGVWPYRTDVTKPPSSPSLIQSVFGGTIEAAGSALTQVAHVINIATSNHPASKPVTKRPEVSDAGVTSTGYYQALALQQFLEQYAQAKKNPANAGWRLVFDIPKQNQSLIVTPMSYTWSQSAAKPLEFMFNLQFKAWRRIDLKEIISPIQPSIQTISPGILQRILGVISAARSTASASLTLISSVRSDIEAPLNALRQTALFVKDLAGVATSVADLPSQIINDYASSINASMNVLSNSISNASSDPNIRTALAAVVASTAAVEGLSLDAVRGGQIGMSAAAASTINPANNIYSNSNANFDLLDSVPVNSLTLSAAQQNAVALVIEEAQQTTVSQLRQYRQTILGLALQLSNSFGAGDAYYNKVYGLPPPTPRIQPMTLDEYDILAAMYEAIQAYDLLTATTEIDDNRIQSNMDYVAGLADLSGMTFNDDTAKILVPVPFGLSVEQISARYLQDPQRWLEIVTLNNLREPYIDENGFQVPLLSNASGREIAIGSIQDLYVGQRVIVQSATQQPSPRVILGIDTLSSTSFLITLDGIANLDNFVIADQAYLQAYLPGTVNSQQKIFVPSTLPVPNDPNIVVPQATLSDPLTGLSKVDLLLTDSGDLAVNNFGDFRFAYGMTNIIQALKIKIGTQAGKILLHPEFGLGIKAGVMTSDFDPKDTFESMNKLIQQDPRFAGINTLEINLRGPELSLNMAVALSGIQGVFPINFVVPV
jgi:hypothetical protein